MHQVAKVCEIYLLAFHDERYYVCTGDILAAKESVARMKYFVNIQELLKDVHLSRLLLLCICPAAGPHCHQQKETSFSV